MGSSQEDTRRLKKQYPNALPNFMLTDNDLFYQYTEMADEAVWVLDCDGRIVYANRNMGELLGCLPEEIIGEIYNEFSSDKQSCPALQDIDDASQQEDGVFQVRIRRKDGTWIQAQSRTRLIYNAEGELQGSFGVFSDENKSLLVENRLRQKNRSLRILSESNQALIRATEEQGFLQEICGILVEAAEYDMAWVGYPFHRVEQWRIAAFSGSAREAVNKKLRSLVLQGKEDIFFRLNDGGEPFIIDKLKESPWNSMMGFDVDTLGLNCAIMMPLFDAEQIIGLLAVFSCDERPFNVEEVDLLSKLAKDLTYGILSLRAKEERKKAREALRFTQFSIDHATDPIYWVGNYGRITDVNAAACKALGYTQEELLKMTVYEIDPKYSKEIWLEQWAKIKESGSLTFESTHQRKDGTVFPVEITSNYLEYNGKYFTCSFVRDITERKRVETALRESEEKFRSLVESTNDWFWEVDEQFRYSYVSPRITELLGYTSVEVIKKQPFDFMPLGEAKKIEKLFLNYVKNREAFSCLENVLIHRDGHHIVVETSGTPIIDGEGQFRGYRGIDRDVTVRRASEHKLTLSLEKLRRSIEGAIEAMALTVEMKDPYTAGHQRRVSQLACAIGKGMGLSEHKVEGIRLAAMVHDIGKIYVPAEILSKPGRISEIEFSLIQTHSKVGFDVLKTIEFPWPIEQIVLQHHERLNGKGYPAGLVGEEILLEAKIICVADVVEAMSSHRPYRPAVGIEHALNEILEQRGLLYDPDVVDVCLDLFVKQDFSFEQFSSPV